MAKFKATMEENEYLTLAGNVTNSRGAIGIKMTLTIERHDIVVVNSA